MDTNNDWKELKKWEDDKKRKMIELYGIDITELCKKKFNQGKIRKIKRIEILAAILKVLLVIMIFLILLLILVTLMKNY